MVKYYTPKGLRNKQEKIGELEKELKKLQSRVQYNLEVGGDQWHDNSGYEDLVQQIRVVDKRLSEAYEEINNVKLIEYPENPKKISCGTRVTYEMDGKEKKN